jgi:nitrate reductase gamma subunit
VTVYLILVTAAGAAMVPGLLMLWLERRERDRD